MMPTTAAPPRDRLVEWVRDALCHPARTARIICGTATDRVTMTVGRTLRPTPLSVESGGLAFRVFRGGDPVGRAVGVFLELDAAARSRNEKAPS